MNATNNDQDNKGRRKAGFLAIVVGLTMLANGASHMLKQSNHSAEARQLPSPSLRITPVPHSTPAWRSSNKNSGELATPQRPLIPAASVRTQEPTGTPEASATLEATATVEHTRSTPEPQKPSAENGGYLVFTSENHPYTISHPENWVTSTESSDGFLIDAFVASTEEKSTVIVILSAALPRDYGLELLLKVNIQDLEKGGVTDIERAGQLEVGDATAEVIRFPSDGLDHTQVYWKADGRLWVADLALEGAQQSAEIAPIFEQMLQSISYTGRTF